MPRLRRFLGTPRPPVRNEESGERSTKTGYLQAPSVIAWAKESMKVAFVTPTYRGDFDRCQLLCESTTRFLPADVEHILIVDRRDVPLFRQLENRTVRIVVGESLTPWWIFRVFAVDGWWASLGSLPLRNWLYQQLLKISAVYATDANIINFVDSDVTLTRPFPLAYLYRDGLVRLQRVAYHDPSHERWLRVGANLLGVREQLSPQQNYIGNFITWTRTNILGMIERIQEVAGVPWMRAVARCLQFSEYMTYGVYVNYVVGLPASGHFHDDSPNLHLCWDYDVQTDSGMEKFLSTHGPENFGIMIHSKYQIPVERYRRRVEEIWSRS